MERVQEPNGLTKAESERLEVLVEELGEAVQRVGKVLRHGYASTHPSYTEGPNNRDELQLELGDVLNIMRFMIASGDLSKAEIEARAKYKSTQFLKYLRHQ